MYTHNFPECCTNAMLKARYETAFEVEKQAKPFSISSGSISYEKSMATRLLCCDEWEKCSVLILLREISIFVKTCCTRYYEQRYRLQWQQKLMKATRHETKRSCLNSVRTYDHALGIAYIYVVVSSRNSPFAEGKRNSGNLQVGRIYSDTTCNMEVHRKSQLPYYISI